MAQPDLKDLSTPSDDELEKYAARTRRSLIMRLGDWKDQRSWDEFYRTYWRLIFSVATKAGLRDDEAWDVVQETIITIAKQSVKGQYDPSRGSFKMWLWHITRWRINDQFRQRRKDTAALIAPPEGNERELLTDIPDPAGDDFSKLWEKEWQENIMKAAIERVKMKVSPQQFQIFDYNVLRGMPAGDVRKKLGVSIAQVYLAKHRVSAVLRKEVAYIRSQEEAPPRD